MVAVCLSGSSPASVSLPRRQRPSFPRRWTVGSRSADSEFHAPNNALQRTAHGDHVFSACQLLRRHEPSLSLEPLGALPLPLSMAGTSVTVRFVGSVCPRSLRGHVLPSGVVFHFGQPFPAAAPVIPPPVGRQFLRRQIPSSTRLTTRSSERRGASVPSSLLFSPPSLSLEALGPGNLLARILGWRACSRSFVGTFWLTASRFLRSSFPVASTRRFPLRPTRGHVLLPGTSSAPLIHPRRQRPSFPRRSPCLLFGPSRGSLCRRGPNHALQRTALARLSVLSCAFQGRR